MGEEVLALPKEGAPARKLERKRLESGLEYLDIWRAIEPAQTSEPVTNYVRLGVSLAPVLQVTRGIYQLALFWAIGFALMMGFLAYLVWPLWIISIPPSPLPREARGELSFGQLIIDDHAKEVRLNGMKLPLTPREYALLRLLASEPARVFSVQEIIERAWSTEKYISSEDVKKYIYLLRQKLERDPRNPQIILTVRGFG